MNAEKEKVKSAMGFTARELDGAWAGSEKFCKWLSPEECGVGMEGVTMSKGPEAIAKKSCVTGESEWEKKTCCRDKQSIDCGGIINHVNNFGLFLWNSYSS